MISRWSPNSRVARGAATALLIGALSIGLTACTQKTPEERLEEAVLMLQQGQLARAVLELRTIVRENPGDPSSAQARMYLAQYYVREGNAARAIEELEAVYAQYGRSEELGREAGDALVSIRAQIGDLEGALKLSDEALASISEDDPRRNEYIVIRASLLLSQEDDEAIAEGRQILRTLMLEADQPWQRGQAREILADTYRSRADFEGSNEVYQAYIDAFPEDSVRSRLELAMAVNLIASGDEEGGRAAFDTAAAQFLKEAEEELDREQKTQMLQELSAYYQSTKDVTGAEQVMLKIMAENPMSMTAIQTQFGIAQMYLGAGIVEENDDYFERGLAILRQIQAENQNSNVAMTAEQMLANAPQSRENYRQQLAAATAAGENAVEAVTEPILDVPALDDMEEAPVAPPEP